MKKITLMMSLLLSLGSMTASAQILSRTGWKITTLMACALMLPMRFPTGSARSFIHA